MIAGVGLPVVAGLAISSSTVERAIEVSEVGSGGERHPIDVRIDRMAVRGSIDVDRYRAVLSMDHSSKTEGNERHSNTHGEHTSTVGYAGERSDLEGARRGSE